MPKRDLCEIHDRAGCGLCNPSQPAIVFSWREYAIGGLILAAIFVAFILLPGSNVWNSNIWPWS